MRRSLSLLAAISFLTTACGVESSDEQPARAATAATVPAAAAAGVRLVRVGSFDQPLYVTAPPGDRRRVFVVEQTGRIRVIRDGRKLGTPFLDLRNQVSCCGERGLLSMAFAPDYATSRRFYVDYTDRHGDTRVVEFRRSGSPDRGVKASARLVLFQRQPESNHNGGLLVFGPDGLLYIGLGDGGGGDDRHGSRGNGQSLGTLLGKILRIDPRASGGRAYTRPAPTTRSSAARGARDEIYALRAAQPVALLLRPARPATSRSATSARTRSRRSTSRARGRAAAARTTAGGVFEGRRRNYPGEDAPGAVPRCSRTRHGGGGCSITGGYVVRDPRRCGRSPAATSTATTASAACARSG